MRRLPALLLVLALASACGTGSDEEARRQDANRPPAASPSATGSTGEGATTPGASPSAPATAASGDVPTDTPSPVQVTPTAPAAANGYVDRCRPQGDAADALRRLAPRQSTISDGDGSRMPVTVVGHGDTLVVLLHQVHGGSCGWQYFLARAGGDARFRFVVPDLCGAGASRCVGEFSLDQVAQTKLVGDWARRTYHPRRTTLLGSSMGGAIVARAAGVGLAMDVGVDLSGPDGWFGESGGLAADLRRASVPLLLVYDPADDPGSARIAAREASRAGSDLRYLEAHGGHGWDNLTGAGGRLSPTAQQVLDFLAG